MLTYPEINPVALQIGPFKVYWYGIMYIVGIVGGWMLARYRVTKFSQYSNRAEAAPSTPTPSPLFTKDEVSDLIFYCAFGVILGGRIGYILFYSFANFIANPLVLFKTWEGGMSFHGGLIGVTIALLLFARKTQKKFIDIADFTAPLVPLGLFFGRIGNFINGEVWGRVTNASWGMVFPSLNAGLLPRHPSQLYEAFGEGIVLFIILWLYSATPKPRGKITALFLLSYGCIRFSCEFFREPDLFLGFIAFNWLTMGQLLSLPMIVIGAWMLWKKQKIEKTDRIK